MARLAALLDDGGRLVLDLANEMGFTDLVSSLPDATLESDAGWHVGAAGFSAGTSSPGSGRASSTAEGLQSEATFAALPSVDHHRLLVHHEAVAGRAPARSRRGARGAGHGRALLDDTDAA